MRAKGQADYRHWCLLLVLAACAIGCRGSRLNAAKSFVVSSLPEQLTQVEAAYKQQGYVIKERNDKNHFLVVSLPISAAAVAAASVTNAASDSSNTPGWVKYGPKQLSSDTEGQQTSSSPDQDATAAYQPSYSPQTEPQVSAAAASATAQSVMQLAAVPGVQKVQQNSIITLLGRHTPSNSHRALFQAAPAPPEASPASCPTATNSFPDSDLGRAAEGTPYGIHMVDADSETMVQISRDKVMWCLIDTGLDVTNPEFDKGSTTGCMPGAVRGDGTSHGCDYAWYADKDGHGTHTSGTIAALRNGQAVVGVSAEGANIYHYNIFGTSDSFVYTDLLRAWDDCLNELDWRKTNTSDLKMVVSMSVGGPGDVQVVADALAKITSSRSDVLFIAAAGNGGDTELNYPGGDPNVVSVAAVDWLGMHASFSTHNSDVEWAAPGVQTLSTVPVWAATQTSWALQTRLTVSPFVPPVNFPGILDTPKVVMMDGSAAGQVSGPLVDCGLGNTTCTNATGNICLVQRGGGLTFCAKVINCLAGGGIAAVIYGRDDQPECEQLTGLTLLSTDCTTPSQGWPVVLTATRGQGTWLKEQIAGGVTVTLKATSDTHGQALNFLSGTSMATPTAAGVAGLVWSYHSNCTAAELRAAISASAVDAGARGRDDLYGFGIVNAVAAHNYLLQHPCAPPAPAPPPQPVNCSGGWEWSDCDKPCGGGQQSGVYKITRQQANGGASCPAAAGATQTRDCNTQACLQAANDTISVMSGRWTAIPVLANDAGGVVRLVAATHPENGGVVKLVRASSAKAGLGAATSVNGSNIVYYLSKAGYTGADQFTYTISDASGTLTTATVSVQVTPGSCKVHNCTSGSCDAATGSCVCTAPGMVPVFVRNPVVGAVAVTPRVPGCRYELTPLEPFMSKVGVTAKHGATIPFSFKLGHDEVCVGDQVVQRAYFSRSTECPSATEMTSMGDSGLKVGMLGCSSGQYTYVVGVTQPVGCYRVVVRFADGRAVSTRFRVM